MRLVPRRPASVINILLVLLLATAGAGAFLLLDQEESTAAPDTTEVSRGQVVSTVSASGNVVAARDVGVDFPTGGRLTEVLVEEGERVEQGQLLARVDADDARDQVSSAEASLRQARGQLAALDSGPSEEDLAAQDASVAQAAASVDTARQAYQDARRVAATSRAVAAEQVRRADAAVNRAEQDLARARRDVRAAEADLHRAESDEDEACGGEPAPDGSTGPGSTSCTAAQSEVSAAEQALSTAEQSDTTAEQTLQTQRDAAASARQNRDTGNAQQAQSVNSARSSLSSAQASYDYTVATARQQLQPPDEGELESARGQVDAAEVTLRSAQRALRETSLRAPAAGVVDSVDGEVGEYVGGGGSGATSADGAATDSGTSTTGTSGTTSSATGFVVLTDVDGLQVEADFSEADVSQLRVGQGASISFEALDGVELNARVSSIATTSVVTDNVVTYLVTVTLQDPPRRIKVGQTSAVEVVLDEAANAIVVPSSAVSTTGTSSTVTVYDDGEEQVRDVEVGVVGDSVTEIVSGLRVGDEVVTSTGGAGGFPTGGLPDLPGGGIGGGL